MCFAGLNMASFDSIPDDCLGVILSFLAPPCTIVDPPVDVYGEALYPYYLQSVIQLDDYSISLHQYYDALEDVLQFSSLNTVCRSIKNRYMHYNLERVQQSIIRYLHYKQYYHDNTNITLPSYTECTHSNSGCLHCKRHLPYWWPNIDNPDNTFSCESVAEWYYQTNGYIKFGLCSERCYEQYTKNKDVLGGFICCKQCTRLYSFADSEFYGQFCSELCRDDYEEELIELYDA